jgi:hypothetical protein
MPTFADTAQQFAQALVDERFDDAWTLLTPQLRQELPAHVLAAKLRAMYESYVPDSRPERIVLDPQFAMHDFPMRQPGDAGWAYVAIEGLGFVEAVTVVVCDLDGRLCIRSIEWGRP